MSEMAAKYQKQITGNGAGKAYLLEGVKFDGFLKGTLLESKGLGYAKLIKDPKIAINLAARWLKQARDQIRAAKGTGAAIEWHVAEAEVAAAIRELFKFYKIDIKVVHTAFIFK